MQQHDLIAELTGYRNELASLERAGKTERAEQVRPNIERVAGEIVAAIEQRVETATRLDGDLQDVDAARAREEARWMARELPDEFHTDRTRALAAGERLPAPGDHDAADHSPAETAVHKPNPGHGRGRGRRDNDAGDGE